jgi:hypothetical protein
MKFRKLRIAWSVGWSLLAVPLIVLWVRSYWWSDQLYCPVRTQTGVALTSEAGRFGLSSYLPSTFVKIWSGRAGEVPTGWSRRSSRLLRSPNTAPAMFTSGSDAYFSYVTFPCWLPVLLSMTLAATPWVFRKVQFSIRTLLIATTLVAVLLGLVVYALRE